MANQTAQQALDSIASSRTVIEPQRRGYDHLLLQPDLKAESSQELREARDSRQHRLDLLADLEAKALAFQEAERALDADGHPNLPTFEVSESVLLDIRENRNEVNAAFDTLMSNAATALGLTAGTIEPKL